MFCRHRSKAKEVEKEGAVAFETLADALKATPKESITCCMLLGNLGQSPCTHVVHYRFIKSYFVTQL